MGSPGKFEACENEEVGRKLYEMSMDGCDDETGDVQSVGWTGLLVDTELEDAPHALLFEDPNGFVTYESFDTEEAARLVFETIARENAALEESAD